MKTLRVQHHKESRGLAAALLGWLAALTLFAFIGFLALKAKGEQNRLENRSRLVQGQIERLNTDIFDLNAKMAELSSRSNLQEALLAKGSYLREASLDQMAVLGEPETVSATLAQNRGVVEPGARSEP
ncbi:MAG TPA: hypothetical protein VMN36_16050 [Verrucomicrobiales bacterium]|nr:hypothetical protein [Verrucomicrobiales bacterium]